MEQVKPDFSVIIPTFNRAGVVGKAIQSVIEQNHQNWECLVVDDGSTDNTSKVVKAFRDKRIKYLYQENAERSRARNLGIKKAQGSYICFLDSDDIYFQDHLSELFSKIKEEDFPNAIFHTEVQVSARGIQNIENWTTGLTNTEVLNSLLAGKALYINAVCISREILTTHQFPDQYNYWEDQHLWVRILDNYPFYSIRKVTTQWNVTKLSSVNTNFQIPSTEKLRNHLACIDDISRDKRYKHLKKRLKELAEKKAFLYLSHSIQRRLYKLNLKQFFVCIKYLGLPSATKLMVKGYYYKVQEVNSKKAILKNLFNF